MALSRTLTATSNTAPDGEALCPTASWCVSHRETNQNVWLHLSGLDAGPSGTLTGIKVYSWGDGEPIGGATIVMFTPLGAAEDLEEWQVDWLHAVFATSG
jgi:hypothetical protein